MVTPLLFRSGSAKRSEGRTAFRTFERSYAAFLTRHEWTPLTSCSTSAVLGRRSCAARRPDDRHIQGAQAPSRTQNIRAKMIRSRLGWGADVERAHARHRSEDEQLPTSRVAETVIYLLAIPGTLESFLMESFTHESSNRATVELTHSAHARNRLQQI